MTQDALTCQGLMKQFGDTVAVRDVTLSAREGEFITLLGPSGCGKTTTLRLIAGFELPDRGQITLRGQVVATAGAGQPPEARRIGMVFQDYALFPHLSVADNVAFGLRAGKAEKVARVAEMLALVGLDGLDRRMPHELSGGQQQRVALARALAPQPGIVLLDEPFSNLDAALRGRVRSEVRAILRAAGVTVVFVTHDQEEALSLSDRVAVMFDGRVAQFASPGEVYDRPATRDVAAFVGESNFVPAEATGETARSPLGEIALVEARRGPVELLIRPEMLMLCADDTAGVPAEVAWVEYYGHSQRVGLRVMAADGEIALVGRFGSRAALAMGDLVRVMVGDAVVAF